MDDLGKKIAKIIKQHCGSHDCCMQDDKSFISSAIVELFEEVIAKASHADSLVSERMFLLKRIRESEQESATYEVMFNKEWEQHEKLVQSLPDLSGYRKARKCDECGGVCAGCIYQQCDNIPSECKDKRDHKKCSGTGTITEPLEIGDIELAIENLWVNRGCLPQHKSWDLKQPLIDKGYRLQHIPGEINR